MLVLLKDLFEDIKDELCRRSDSACVKFVLEELAVDKETEDSPKP